MRGISSAEHASYIAAAACDVSFSQTPAWGVVREKDWQTESLGWFRGGELVGVGLAMYRHLPGSKRTMAYLPEGPVIDWSSGAVPDYLEALASYLRSRRAFAVRIGPSVVTRSWRAGTVKKALAEPSVHTFTEVTPDAVDAEAERIRAVMQDLGWREYLVSWTQVGAGRPKYTYRVPIPRCDESDLLAGMSQSWRRNIRKAEKAGVTVERGDRDDLRVFHRIYAETAARDNFMPHPPEFFEHIWDAMNAESPGSFGVYLARQGGHPIAATTVTRIGTQVRYLFGGSTTSHRDARGSNAIQWRMLCDALAEGADEYDLYGIGDTVDRDDPLVGLVRFKVGAGGEVVEHLGEWDLPIDRLAYAAFTRLVPTYLRLRGQAQARH